MNPIQPFFVLNTEHYYKQVCSHPLISHFYRFRDDSGDAGENITIPDGATDIVFDLYEAAPSVMICGTVTQGRPGLFESGHEYFGVRLRPGALSHVGCAGTDDLCGQVCHLESGPARSLAGRLGAEPDFRRQIRLFMDEYPSLLEAGPDMDSHALLARAVIRCIDEARGCITLSALEEQLCYSRRHLTRVFREYTGITIKEFCRFVRFQCASRQLSRSSTIPIAQLALDCGYYDQAHFQKDFRDFTMSTPGACQHAFARQGFASRLIVLPS